MACGQLLRRRRSLCGEGAEDVAQTGAVNLHTDTVERRHVSISVSTVEHQSNQLHTTLHFDFIKGKKINAGHHRSYESSYTKSSPN
jgi:hypothetical protein